MVETREDRSAKELRDTIAQFVGIDVDNLISSKTLSIGEDMSFGIILVKLKFIREALLSLDNSDLERVPHEITSQIKGRVENFTRKLEEIRSFSVAQMEPSPIQRRGSLIKDFDRQYTDFFKELSLMSPLVIIRDHSTSRVQSILTEFQKDTESRAASIINTISKSKEEADTALESIRSAAGTAGVNYQSTSFQDEAENYRKSSNKWLIAGILTGLLALSTLLWTSIAVLDPGTVHSRDDLIAFISGKASIIIFLLLVANWISKNYRANRHNYVVNKHRYNALRTFQAFTSAAKDESTKDAVLLRSAEAIFKPINSGYSRGDNDFSESSKIVEVVRPSSRGPE